MDIKKSPKQGKSDMIIKYPQIRNFIGRYESYIGRFYKMYEISNDWLDNIISWEIERRSENDMIPFYIMEKQFRNEREIYVK